MNIRRRAAPLALTILWLLALLLAPAAAAPGSARAAPPPVTVELAATDDARIQAGSPDVSFPGGFLAQGRQAFRNVERVLAVAGATLGDVVKVGIFVRDMATNLPHVIELRGEFLAEPYPADTLLEISSLAQPDWLIEVEVIAVAPDPR